MNKKQLKQLFLDTLEFKINELSKNPRMAEFLDNVPEDTKVDKMTWQYLCITGLPSLGYNGSGQELKLSDLLESGSDLTIKTLINKMPDGGNLGALRDYDLNKDGKVDSTDEDLVLIDPNPSKDLNNDGVVDDKDKQKIHSMIEAEVDTNTETNVTPINTQSQVDDPTDGPTEEPTEEQTVEQTEEHSEP